MGVSGYGSSQDTTLDDRHRDCSVAGAMITTKIAAVYDVAFPAIYIDFLSYFNFFKGVLTCSP